LSSRVELPSFTSVTKVIINAVVPHITAITAPAKEVVIDG